MKRHTPSRFRNMNAYQRANWARLKKLNGATNARSLRIPYNSSPVLQSCHTSHEAANIPHRKNTGSSGWSLPLPQTYRRFCNVSTHAWPFLSPIPVTSRQIGHLIEKVYLERIGNSKTFSRTCQFGVNVVKSPSFLFLEAFVKKKSNCLKKRKWKHIV